MATRSPKKFPVLLFILVVLLGLAGVVSIYWQFVQPRPVSHQKALIQTTPTPDPYVNFAKEVYDKIKEHYWDKIADDKLSELFRLAAAKISGHEEALVSKDQNGVSQLASALLQSLPAEKRPETAARLADLVLANLQPFGRSRLYTAEQTAKLKNDVENVDPQTNLYAILGISPEATLEEIAKSYQQKSAELKKSSSAKSQETLIQITRAYEAFSTPEKKQTYDQTKAEPTVTAKFLRPDIFYIKLLKFSPRSFEEFKTAANSVESEPSSSKMSLGGPTTLIFDLRHNIGGAIDILPYFLGPFIGPDQYAYEFFHQEERTPFKTKTGWLKSLTRYKKVVILVDGQSQSSAEVMASTLKKYHVGVLVGTPTKGWGTIEQIVPLDQQFDPTKKLSMLIAQSITLREDGQPIESRGIEPDVNINDKNWPQQLSAYFNYPTLITVLKELLKQ